MIACILGTAAPVVVGDLLLSGNNKPDNFLIPTFSEDVLQYLDGTDRHPVWLTPKVYILKPNLCIAFSGKVFYFKQFLEDIRMFCRITDTVTTDNLNTFLKQHEHSEAWKHFSFVILLAALENQDLMLGTVFHGQWLNGEAQLYGEIWTTGSGSLSLIQEVVSRVDLDSTYTIDQVDYAMQVNTMLICKLLSRERATLHTIRKHWGAGFEMVYFEKGRFTKLDEITYIINQGRFDEKGDIAVPVPAVILHYKYYRELLVITVIHPHKGQTEETDSHYIIRCPETSARQFIVAPLDYQEGEEVNELSKDASFTSAHIAMGYIIETPAGYFLPASVNTGSELEINYKQGDTVVITLMKDVNNRLAAKAKVFFDNLNK